VIRGFSISPSSSINVVKVCADQEEGNLRVLLGKNWRPGAKKSCEAAGGFLAKNFFLSPRARERKFLRCKNMGDDEN